LVSAGGASNNRAWIVDLKDASRPRLDGEPRVVSAEEDSIVNLLGVAKGKLFIQTTFQAPNGRIVAAAIGDPDRSHWTTVVPESKDAIRDSLLLRDRLVVHRLQDVQSRLELYDLAGKPAAPVK